MFTSKEIEEQRDREQAEWWKNYHATNTETLVNLKLSLPVAAVENAEIFLSETPHNVSGIPYKRDIAFYRMLIAMRDS